MMDAKYIASRDHGWRAMARYSLTNDGWDLHAAYKEHDGMRVVLPLTFSEVGPVGIVGDQPMLGFTSSSWECRPECDAHGFLQAMMEIAWDLGMRPSKLDQHNSELTAVRYHLEDMRALAKVPSR